MPKRHTFSAYLVLSLARHKGNLSAGDAGASYFPCMAHFPQSHPRTRSPRVRVPDNESVNFNVGNKQMAATLQTLSLTGGLVRFTGHIGDLALAEVVLNTTSGPVKALVEFLKAQAAEGPASRPFRFIALDDADYTRLAATLQLMRKQGYGEGR